MTFGDYADGVHDAIEDHRRDVVAGVVAHGPLTREQAAEEAQLQAERNARLADLFDNDNPESLWYG